MLLENSRTLFQSNSVVVFIIGQCHLGCRQFDDCVECTSLVNPTEGWAGLVRGFNATITANMQWRLFRNRPKFFFACHCRAHLCPSCGRLHSTPVWFFVTLRLWPWSEQQDPQRCTTSPTLNSISTEMKYTHALFERPFWFFSSELEGFWSVRQSWKNLNTR